VNVRIDTTDGRMDAAMSADATGPAGVAVVVIVETAGGPVTSPGEPSPVAASQAAELSPIAKTIPTAARTAMTAMLLLVGKCVLSPPVSDGRG
jgi:hypothetical protein